MEFDSKEELYISWWLDELKNREYVQYWTKSSTYNLFEGQTELKLRPHSYTPDFNVTWTEKGLELAIFHPSRKSNVECSTSSILEVKGNYDAQNMTRLFKINQKWMFKQFGIYVNLVKPEELFKKTFCPDRYRLTDGGKSERKLKQSYLTLDEYIQQYRQKGDDRKGVQKNRERKLQ